MAFIPYLTNCKEQPRISIYSYMIRTSFGVFITDSCSISEYILVNRDGFLAYSCDSSRMQPIPPNSRNAIVSLSLQYRKTSRMDTKILENPRILNFINSREFGS